MQNKSADYTHRGKLLTTLISHALQTHSPNAAMHHTKTHQFPDWLEWLGTGLEIEWFLSGVLQHIGSRFAELCAVLMVFKPFSLWVLFAIRTLCSEEDGHAGY